MKPYLILALAALAHARPEAGYAYNAPSAPASPSSSYGAPSSGGGHGFGGGSGHGHGFGGGSGSGHGLSGHGAGFGGHGSGASSSFGGSQAFSSGASSFGGSSLGGSSFGGSSLGGSSFGGSSFGGSSFGGGNSFTSGGSSFGGYQAPLVSKHVYVHVAPEEPEVRQPARINAPTQARKHYKIVFIKAPTAPTPTAAQVQLPQQDEEKTIIYVLSKKQEEQPDIQVQSAAPTTPTKPEVYFIKYNTKKEESGAGLSLSAGAAPSSSYGPPSSLSANAIAPSNTYIPAPAAPSSSYGVPSAHGGPY